MATAAERRAAEAARIKAENEARKQRVAESRTAAPTPTLTNTQEALARLQPMSTPAPAPTPAPKVSEQQQAKAIENLVTLAISGGSQEDVKKAVEAVQQTTPTPATAPTLTNTQEALNRLQPVSKPITALTPTEQATFTTPVIATPITLPPAFIPARTVVDMTGTAVVVDINGKDASGSIVKELPEGTTGTFFADIANEIAFQESVVANTPALAAEVNAGNMGAVLTTTGITGATVTATTSPVTTSLDVIKAGLRGLGLKGNIIDSGASFIDSLLREGLDFDNAVDVFIENKEYTLKNGNKIESPFYKEYGYLNEYALDKKDPAELFGFVTGVEGLVKKYNISPKFASREKLIEATKNAVSVKDLDLRANIARLKAITADPVYVDALKRLGYISTNENLTDFYLDTSVGVEEFENRRRTSYLTSEALRRASAGITIDTTRMQQLASTLGAQGYTAEQVQNIGTQAYETIAQQLPELSKLSGIFEQGRAARPQDIQQELESEQLLGMASQRRKRLEQANINIFSGESGRARTRTSTAGMI